MRVVLARGVVEVHDAPERVQTLLMQHPQLYMRRNNAHLEIPGYRYLELVMLLDQTGIPYERRYRQAIPPGFRVEGIGQATKLPLYPFQIEGASFLVHARACVLADVVGAGKTVQALAAASYLFRQGQVRRALVLAPASIKLQWGDETARFTDIPAQVVYGEAPQRKEQWAKVTAPSFSGLAIANWELIHHDPQVAAYARSCELIILDEAERIRNYKTKTFRFLKDIQPPYRWALTGTPLQIRVEELFSLFRWVDPRVFGYRVGPFLARYCIQDRFGKVVSTNTKHLGELRARIAPYILRRTHEEIGQQLPELSDDTVRVYMTPVQAQLHEAIRQSLRELLDAREEELVKWAQGEDTGRFREERISRIILGRFALLKMVAACPKALLRSESPFVARLISQVPEKLLGVCPKIDWLVDRMVGHEELCVVVFSEFERVARIAYEALVAKGIPAVFESGATPAKERDQAQKLFQLGAVRAFVSTDAGSRGINLQAGSEVIHLDLPWNPSTLTQRNGRIRRLGSRHSHVRSVRLLSAASVDEQVQRRIYERQQLFDALIEGTRAVRRPGWRKTLSQLIGP